MCWDKHLFTAALKLVLTSLVLIYFIRSWEWEYLSFRLCIGVWVGILLLILVALDASAFVCFITRFTEENFALLIAMIFIVKAIENIGHIGEQVHLQIFLDGWSEGFIMIQPKLCRCKVYVSTPSWVKANFKQPGLKNGKKIDNLLFWHSMYQQLFYEYNILDLLRQFI